jgi:tetratricopeptide (TPR) repeat protein
VNFREWMYWIFGGRGYRRLYKLVNQGFAQVKSEDYDKARSTFLQVLEFRDQMAGLELLDWVLISLESTWLFRDEYDGQVTFFSDYVRRYSGDAQAYCARADAFWYLGRLPEAVNDYNRAIDLKPDAVRALSGRAQVLAEMDEHEHAIEELDRARIVLEKNSRANPRLAEYNRHIEAFLHRVRGVALAGLGKTDAAMNEFAISITLCSENAWVFYSRAEVHEKMGDSSRAVADYRLSLEKKGPRLSLRQREQAQVRLRYFVSS